MQWWQELSFQFMTEESGGESTDEITCHPLPWRSESEFKLMHIHMQAHKLHYSITVWFVCRGNKVHTQA